MAGALNDHEHFWRRGARRILSIRSGPVQILKNGRSDHEHDGSGAGDGRIDEEGSAEEAGFGGDRHD